MSLGGNGDIDIQDVWDDGTIVTCLGQLASSETDSSSFPFRFCFDWQQKSRISVIKPICFGQSLMLQRFHFLAVELTSASKLLLHSVTQPQTEMPLTLHHAHHHSASLDTSHGDFNLALAGKGSLHSTRGRQSEKLPTTGKVSQELMLSGIRMVQQYSWGHLHFLSDSLRLIIGPRKSCSIHQDHLVLPLIVS